jgi:hypothetical protein
MRNLQKNVTFQKILSNNDFLGQIQIDQEPVRLLGRYFAQVAQLMSDKGYTLAIEPIERLVEINSDNQVGWRRLLPLFNPDLNDLDDDNSFCLIARNVGGMPIASGACRLYNWTSTNFAAQLENRQLFYADPYANGLDFEACEVTAVRARRITGKAVFAGAAWCHPSVRGQSLSSIIPRTSKALALAKWDFDSMVGLMLEDIVKLGFAQRFGYNRPEQAATIIDHYRQEKKYAVLGMPRVDVIRHVEGYLAGGRSEIDGVIRQRLPQ